MTLVPLCLVVWLVGLSEGGVLHHREHAALKERGLGGGGGGGGGSGHGALGNYVAPRPHDNGEEKLRVIKITRTYAIPYPVHVPLAKVPHQSPAASWSHVNLPHGNAGFSSGYPHQTGGGYNGLTGNGYHGSADSGYQALADHLLGFPLGGPDLTHNSIEHSGSSEFFSGHGSLSGNHGYSGGHQGYSGGNHGYSGSNHGYAGGHQGYSGGNQGYSGGNRGYSQGNQHSLQDDVYQRHGYSTAKPFRPSQEYTPPELNDHSYLPSSQW